MATLDFKPVHPVNFHVSPPPPYASTPTSPIRDKTSRSNLATPSQAPEQPPHPVDTETLFALFKNTTETISKRIDNIQCYIHAFTKQLNTIIVAEKESVKNHLQQTESNLNQSIVRVDNKCKVFSAEVRRLFAESSHNLAEFNGGLKHVFTSTDIALANMSKRINVVSENHQTINSRVHKLSESLRVALDQVKKLNPSIDNNRDLCNKNLDYIRNINNQLDDIAILNKDIHNFFQSIVERTSELERNFSKVDTKIEHVEENVVRVDKALGALLENHASLKRSFEEFDEGLCDDQAYYHDRFHKLSNFMEQHFAEADKRIAHLESRNQILEEILANTVHTNLPPSAVKVNNLIQDVYDLPDDVEFRRIQLPNPRASNKILLKKQIAKTGFLVGKSCIHKTNKGTFILEPHVATFKKILRMTYPAVYYDGMVFKAEPEHEDSDDSGLTSLPSDSDVSV
ncbi:hypothetical protein BDK51DRAFT_45124 [Blyttiomyces helicus]|uniref:Uncharacterized protein n=1 Tax=Blyttiomyces helicus TaxID=388810 RepID=A0A4P9WM70_9FUNG|nr:hypothetical protein BDK51DRAFT_45124 [Blyttiomyces helicus]|eukprot:RKO94004.1 hypothetical protein BDK51DRAFT_45124 [Blyttiomyces helicus]